MSLAFAMPLPAQVIITDRPDFADATTPVPVGMFQMEMGYSFSRHGMLDQHTLGEVLMKTGLVHDRLELRVGFNSWVHASALDVENDGSTDGSLGLKYRLCQGKEDRGLGSFNLSTIVFSTLPTGSADMRAAHMQPGAMLTSDLALSERFAVAPFFQYEYLSAAGGQYSQASAGLSVLASLSSTTGWFVEYYGVLVEEGFGEDTNFVGTGVTYLVRDDWQFDIYGGQALNGVDPNWYLGFGMSFYLDFR